MHVAAGSHSCQVRSRRPKRHMLSRQGGKTSARVGGTCGRIPGIARRCQWSIASASGFNVHSTLPPSFFWTISEVLQK